MDLNITVMDPLPEHLVDKPVRIRSRDPSKDPYVVVVVKISRASFVGKHSDGTMQKFLWHEIAW